MKLTSDDLVFDIVVNSALSIKAGSGNSIDGNLEVLVHGASGGEEEGAVLLLGFGGAVFEPLLALDAG